MSNRINGDFNAETIEAFRSAYAAQILEPEDQEIDARTGLPTNLVLNTSPWIQHTGLWKANDGTDKNFVPNQTLVPGVSDEDDEDQLSEAELEDLLDEVLDEIEMEELLADLESFDEDFDDSEEGEEDEEMSEEELEELVSEILSDYGDDNEEGDGGEEELDEEDIDALIAELEQELEGEE